MTSKRRILREFEDLLRKAPLRSRPEFSTVLNPRTRLPEDGFAKEPSHPLPKRSSVPMKPNARNPFLVTILLIAASPLVHADLFDTNGTTAGFGVTNGSTYDWWGAGLWSDGTAAGNDAGTAAVVTWQGISGNSQQAFFVGSGTAGQNYTVRLGSTGTTDTYIQNIALNVNAAGSGALTGAAGNVTIGNTGDAGKLILNAANSVGAQNSGTLTINNGINLNGFVMNYRGGNMIVNGSVSGTGASNISSGSGAFGLSAGTLTLAGDNSFAGSTNVASGYIFSLQHANALGATGGTNTVISGGTMEVAGGVTIASGESISIAGDGVTAFGALRAGTGGGTWAGGVTLTGAGVGPRIGATAGNTLTVTGTIANGTGNSFNISGQSGTGVVILNPTTSNTYTGTTGVIRGVLRLGKTNALPTGTTLDVDSANSVSDAATFDLNGFSQEVGVLQDSATSNINGRITNSVASTISTLTVNQASSTTFDGVIENGSGSVVLTKSGAGNLTFNGANTFTGGTNIKNGAITIGGGNDRLATGGSVVLGDVATSGKLVLGDGTNARNQTLAGLTATGLGGSVVGNAAANSTLTLNIASGSNAFGGTLGGSGTNENRLALTKTGAGTLNLTGANTYSGTTTLTTGTIQLGVASVGSVGAITSSAIGTGGLTFNGGTLSSDGGTDRTILNPVTFTGNAVLGNATTNGKLIFAAGLDLGGAARTITVNSDVQLDGSFANSNATSGLVKTGTGTLTINAANTTFGGTAGFSIQNGTVIASNTASMGNAGQILSLGTSTTTGVLDLATDTTANAYVLNVGSGNTGTAVVNRATSGSTMTHTMGNATIGNSTLNIQKGANVTGDATLEFTGLTMSAGATGLSTGTMLNPTTAKVLVSGNITRTGGSANLLTLDGTSSGNRISGIISGPQALTKSNVSTWELSNANTFTGNTKVTGGTLVLSNNLALQSSAFDTSGAGTLDTSATNTPTFGGLTSATDYSISSNVTSLTLNPSAGTQTYTGNLGGGAAGMTLTKSGAGTQILSGTNSYSGLTTVSGGELRITNAAAIGGTNVTVTAGQIALDGGITVSGKSLTTSGSGTNFFGGLQSVSGTNGWSGGVLLGADLSRMGARRNATLVLSGAIDDGANTYNLVIRNENQNNTSGGGNATTITELSGVSTYGGNTQLIAGVTRLAGGDNRLPTGTVLQFGGSGANAKFDMNGRNQEVAGLAVMSTNIDTQRDWNANELTNSSGTLSTLTVNTTANQTFGRTTTSFGGSGSYTGIITGNIALEKSGAATLTLTGTNTYSGATTVEAGTLALGTGGSISASTTIDVKGSATLDVSALAGWALANSQTLKGNGTVNAGTGNVVTISNGAFLAPGASPGTLLVNGDLSFASGSTFSAELQTSGGLTGDLVDLSGDLEILSGAVLDLSLFGSDAALTNGTKFSLFSYSGSWNSGTFNGYADDSDFTLGLNQFRIDYNDTVAGLNGGSYSNFVTLTAVPEPRAALLASLGLLALLRRRRAA